MKTTMDKAGRLVIPKELRLQVGLWPGEVDLIADGNGVRIEQPGNDELAEVDGRLVIPHRGAPIDDEMIRALLDAGRR